MGADVVVVVVVAVVVVDLVTHLATTTAHIQALKRGTVGFFMSILIAAEGMSKQQMRTKARI